jgi:hypothetical protein
MLRLLLFVIKLKGILFSCVNDVTTIKQKSSGQATNTYKPAIVNIGI